MSKIIRLLAPWKKICLLSSLIVILLGFEVKAEEFPLIIDSPSVLRQIGLAMNFSKDMPPLKNKCYYYGDGGYLISTSDEFYNRFRQRGFSIEAMCLGLVSETHFDPASGRRLPTYILIDRAQMRDELRQFGQVQPGTVSEELPLNLPDCFRNADPYTDCRFRFGRITGKTLTAGQTSAYQRLGAAIDKTMAVKIRHIAAPEEFLGKDPNEELLKGYRHTSGYSLLDEIQGAVPDDLKQYSSASIWIRSNHLARGFGYGLDADGGSDPDLNPNAVKAATEGLSKPQIDVQRLRKIVNSASK